MSENTTESTENTLNANEVKSAENAAENLPASESVIPPSENESVTEKVTAPENTQKEVKPEEVKPKEIAPDEVKSEEAKSEEVVSEAKEIIEAPETEPEPEKQIIIHYNGNTVVAIDGPSGTGKSSTAKLLAKRLNYLYIDSGAMYRAVTYSVLQNKIPVTEIAQIIEHTKGLDIILEDEKVLLNGEDISAPVRGVQVTSNVSTISAIKEVREMLVAKQREYALTNSVVMDGRDIGTVVFPFAQYKYFLICDLKTRAARRQQDFRDLGLELATNKIVMELRKRDDIDTKREESPLRKADDAVEVDTTNMIIEEQVECIYRKIVPK